MTIEKLAEDAKNIREKLLISKHRETIENLFNSTSTPELKDIEIRLIVIDSLFSTNSIQMRSNSLYKLAEEINEITNKSDNVFCAYVREYLNTKKAEEKLFDHEYGNDKKREHSLISKYCFFVTKNQFPIIDKFVKNFSKFTDQESLINKIEKINQAKKELSYDNFDAIVWVYSKIVHKKKLIDKSGKDILGSEDVNNFESNVRALYNIKTQYP